MILKKFFTAISNRRDSQDVGVKTIVLAVITSPRRRISEETAVKYDELSLRRETPSDTCWDTNN